MTATETTVTVDLRPLIERVAADRRRLAEKSESLAALRRDFEETHADTIAAEADARAQLAESERALREAAIALYKAQPTTKQLAPGVGIQERKTLVYNAKLALEWAKEKGMCLTLDKSAFEAHAKALLKTGDAPSWLEQKTSLTATISKDLAKALGNPAGGAA